MGWFSKKPEVGDVYKTTLEADEDNCKKLKGYHPVVVVELNEDDSVRVMGCSSKKKDKDDKILLTNPEMQKTTYVRTYQGARDVENKNLININGHPKATNLQEFTKGL
jgi:hypothetical protein